MNQESFAHRGTRFTSLDPRFRRRMQATFRRRGFMQHLGARIVGLQPGHCEVEAAFGNRLSGHPGCFHGGLIATLADVASGYAAFSLTKPHTSVVTVEIKINFLAPARGERLIARGSVVKPGKTLTICRCDVVCFKHGVEAVCAAALATFMVLPGKPRKLS